MGDNHGHFGPGARRMLIDFAGGDLDGLEASQPIKAQVAADGAAVDALTVQRVPQSGVWRVTFVVTPKQKKPIDLHCYLQLYGEVLTETWANQWTP
jgi:glucans biosynthesis protein